MYFGLQCDRSWYHPTSLAMLLVVEMLSVVKYVLLVKNLYHPK